MQYKFNPKEVAEIVVLIDKINHLFHNKRTYSEFEEFQKKNYDLIRSVYYKNILEKITNDRHILISEKDILANGNESAYVIAELEKILS